MKIVTALQNKYEKYRHILLFVGGHGFVMYPEFPLSLFGKEATRKESNPGKAEVTGTSSSHQQ